MRLRAAAPSLLIGKFDWAKCAQQLGFVLSHMRRLAKQQRNDDYASRRDYQKIISKRGISFAPKAAGQQELVLRKIIDTEKPSRVGFGGYLRSDKPLVVDYEVVVNGEKATGHISIDQSHWWRFGCMIDSASAGSAVMTLRWSGKTPLHVWGLNAGPIKLSETITKHKDFSNELLRASHLAPETFYLEHENPLNADIVEDVSSKLASSPGPAIQLKKCSYDGRMLPLDSKRHGILAFHRHKAKLTKHQNECRACKKWRINNHFNILRTADQFHESSAINRERRLLLREPEILQTIKDRKGDGLKSIIWKKFDEKCFVCGKILKLSEVQLDHTRPLAYLWPIDQHATCLCAVHNNEKREKFPSDFYSEQQLQRLSKICGLSMKQLQVRDVNEHELKNILKDVQTFAKTWEPRTFQAIARRVKEVRPSIDLFDLLKLTDSTLHAYVTTEIAKRPPAVIADDLALNDGTLETTNNAE